jgi:hypothetical protein
MLSLRNAFTEKPGTVTPEAREEHIEDLEFEVMLERRFYKPLLRTVGGLVVAETVMTAHDMIIQQQGLIPENALGIVGAVAGTLTVRRLSQMVRRRTEAATLELELLTSELVEPERVLEPVLAEEALPEIGLEAPTQELPAVA